MAKKASPRRSKASGKKKSKAPTKKKPASKKRASSKTNPPRKAASPSKPKKRAAAARGKTRSGPAGSHVEERWNEYWQCRQDLETAVARVQEAGQMLSEAQEAERAARAAFNEIKGSLTELLDVDPADPDSDLGAEPDPPPPSTNVVVDFPRAEDPPDETEESDEPEDSGHTEEDPEDAGEGASIEDDDPPEDEEPID